MTFEEWDTQTAINPTTLAAKAVRCTIADWKADRDKLLSDRRRLVEALREIANSNHQSYDGKESQYGIGVADGHRCAANIARAILAEMEEG